MTGAVLDLSEHLGCPTSNIYFGFDQIAQVSGDIRGPFRSALEYLETILRYVVGSSDQLSSEELTQVVREVLQEGEKLMPTIAEQWFKEGEVVGFEKGKEEGREATLSLLRRFLAMRFEVELDHFEADFATLDLAAITKLSDTAFEAKTLAEFKAVLVELHPEQADKDQPTE